MKKIILTVVALGGLIFTNQLVQADENFTACLNQCICGNDSNGNGTLNETEYNEMVAGDKSMPTFSEIDDDRNGEIDSTEIQDVPGCK